MKKLLLVFSCIGILGGCASHHDWGHMTQSQITAWKNAGFTAEQAEDWREMGLNAYQAKQWVNAGFTEDSAEKWLEEHFTAQEAKQWVTSGFSLDEAVEERAEGLQPID